MWSLTSLSPKEGRVSEFLAYGEATWHSGINRDAIVFHTNITDHYKVYENQQFQIVGITERLNLLRIFSWICFHPQAIMSSYGAPTLVNVPRLNEMNAIQGIMSLLQHVDKGELKDLLDNEEQLNVIISDNDEVSFSVLA